MITAQALKLSMSKSARAVWELLPILVAVLLLAGLMVPAVPLLMHDGLLGQGDWLDTLVAAGVGSVAAGQPLVSYLLAGELLSEGSFTGLGVGAALAGLRPVVEIMTINFALLALDAIINMSTKIPFMSGGQFAMPLVVRMPGGVAKQLAAQHSHRLEQILMNVPGMRIAVPATPQDAYWQLRQAIRSNEAVVLLEHELLYFTRGMLDTTLEPLPMHCARVRREGSDLTLVTYSRMVDLALRAAERLGEQGITVEVVDLRSLRPIDWETCASSLEKTHRLLVVEEDSLFAGAGAEVVASLTDRCFYSLDAPPKRLAARELPIPYNGKLEAACIPDVASIVDAASALARA